MNAMAEPIVTAVPKAPAERREPDALEFPGCRPVRIARDEIADCEFRFEYWDADTEIAMVCEPVSYYHERPAHRLGRLAGLIASARGAPIEAVGHTDLLVRNARGERQGIIQADQILFLRPAQAIPRGNAIEVGTDTLPDVVLEVDNTTDVRRGKLGLYESWGFPEARGVSVSASLSERLAEMEDVPERLMDAALACRDEEEFLRLVSRA